MGRLLNAATVASLAEQTRIDFTIGYPVTTGDIAQKKETGTAYREADLTYYADNQKQYFNIWTLYSDARGNPAFSISYLYPREITQKGLASIRYALAIAIGTASAILLMIFIFLELVVMQPIKKLTDHASRLDREGDYSIQLAFNRRDELGRLARVLDFVSATIAERTDELKRVNKELEKLSSVDALTGVANRRRFDDHMEKEWLRAARQNTRLSMILADVDHFKHYNDFYGHQEGDRCLRAIASAIQRQVTRPADLVARYGGEEFAVILPETEAKGACMVAEKIRRAVHDLQIDHQGSEAADVVTLSLGINSITPGPEDEKRAFIQKADESLYQAKKTGRNTAVLAGTDRGAD
jgi:diguanylate cyclase (GGDEF)-like protein